jgi:hypothetical protein
MNSQKKPLRSPASKKVYAGPVLQVYGNLEQITSSSQTATGRVDGGNQGQNTKNTN